MQILSHLDFSTYVIEGSKQKIWNWYYQGTGEEADFEMSLSGFESDMEQQLIKLFRRLALPFKKANRR